MSTEDKEKRAAEEGRIISKWEGNMRKRIGLIGLGLTSLVVGLTPALHQSYAGVSVLYGMFITTYRMGQEHL